MLRAMYSGITGLRNFQTQMDVLGNNIANVSTVGFKGSRVTFQTTLLQTLSSGKAPQDAYGGTNPVQIGLGAKVSSVDKVMNQGSFQNTGKKTDLAIQGDGFFVLSDGQGQYFTRAGNFSLDDTGYLVNPSSGMKLQGWSSKISSSGQRYVDTNDPIADVKISAGLVMSAKQTTQVTLAHNLNADVGIDETTMVIKSSLGKNLPIRFKFDRIMSNDYKDRYVYNWDAEVIDPDGRYNLMQETATGIQGSTNIKGTIELDESGNVISWQTFKTDGTVADNSKISLYDVKGELKDVNGADASVTTSSGSSNLTGNLKLIDSMGAEVYYDPSNVSIVTTNNDVTVTLTKEDGSTMTFTKTYDDPATAVVETNTITRFNEIFTQGIDDTTGVYTISGLSLSGVGVDTVDAGNYGFSSVREIIQPPSGGAIKFVDINNPANFVVSEYTNPTVSSSTLVYDSLGKDYNVYTKFTKIDTNTWYWKAELADGTPLYKLASDGTRENSIAEGVLAFDGNGQIAATHWRLNSDGTVDTNITDSNNGAFGFWFDPSEVGSALNPTVPLSSTAGAGPVSIELKFQEITQFSAPHSVAVTEQDGNSEGTLESFAINEIGQVIGTFTNGKTDTLGQVALAVFNNPAGLLETGNSMYVQSANSGLAQIGVMGVGGRGTIIPGALEMSNVDLAEEFTNMIVAQRGFQATSRIITTADQILQELVNIKR